jgi:hypothetical protein
VKKRRTFRLFSTHLVLLAGQLRPQQAEPLLTRDALAAELVVWAEARGVRAVRGRAGLVLFLEGVDAVARVVDDIHQVHGCWLVGWKVESGLCACVCVSESARLAESGGLELQGCQCLDWRGMSNRSSSLKVHRSAALSLAFGRPHPPPPENPRPLHHRTYITPKYVLL